MAKEKIKYVKQSRFHLYFIIFVLLCISFAEGYIIVKGKMFVDKYPAQESFVRFFGKEFRKDKKKAQEMFDKHFNDDFFERRKDPFNDMDKIKKEIYESLDGESRESFTKEFDNWYTERFGGSGITHGTQIGKTFILVDFHIPGMVREGLDVTVKNNVINVNGKLKEIVEEKDETGAVTKKEEIIKGFHHTITVPSQADPSNFKVDFDAANDDLKVFFNRKD